MTPELLREVGESLYGRLWQSDLARALGVNDRTMRRWASGESSMPPGLAGNLVKACRVRTGEIAAMIDKLRSVRD